MDIDLNENNYDYNSLLELFSLRQDFDINDLKVAKRKVLKLHPDKCGLDMKYFVFFYKMYQKVVHIYDYIHHETDVKKMNKQVEIDTHFKDYLERNKIDPIKNYERYTAEFNKMFEHVYVKDDSSGYNDWMKSDDDFYDKNDIEKSRKKAIAKSSIVLSNEIEEVGSLNQMSQKLYGYDVKESHGNPILNIDIEKTYRETPKFNSVQEYQLHLRKQEKSIQHYSNSQSEALLSQKNQMLNNQAKNLAYQHLCHQEKVKSNYNNYVSKYLHLEK